MGKGNVAKGTAAWKCLKRVEDLLLQAQVSKQVMSAPPVSAPPPEEHQALHEIDAKTAERVDAYTKALHMNKGSAEMLREHLWLLPYVAALDENIPHAEQMDTKIFNDWGNDGATISVQVARGSDKHSLIEFSVNEKGRFKIEKDKSGKSEILKRLLVLVNAVADNVAGPQSSRRDHRTKARFSELGIGGC